MSVILLRLEGPMQSWGIGSRFSERHTEAEPTKSGVIGLVASALGRSRDESIEDLAQMKMGVRIDREGQIFYDYHTILDVLRANVKGEITKSKLGTVISRRFYIADACFLVGFESENKELLKKILTATSKPKWPLFLGRKSFPPSSPIVLTDKIYDDSLSEVLKSFKWQGRKEDDTPLSLRLVSEAKPNEGELRMDVPISFQPNRYRSRYVSTEFIPFEKLENEV